MSGFHAALGATNGACIPFPSSHEAPPEAYFCPWCADIAFFKGYGSLFQCRVCDRTFYMLNCTPEGDGVPESQICNNTIEDVMESLAEATEWVNPEERWTVTGGDA